MKYDLIMPIAKDDIYTAIDNIPYIRKYLQPDCIIILSNKEIKSKVESLKGIIFFDENEIVPGLTLDAVRNVLKSRGSSPNRSGWYLQQFLKMGYSFISETEYYLAWDADTVPLQEIKLFDIREKPFFTIKTEYHKPYFITIKRVLDIEKKIKGSYIAEHMIFHRGYMRELIEKIEENENNSGLWFEKILRAIDLSDLPNSGFSEFEAYGNYIETYHKETYINRKLNTLRFAKLIFDSLPDQEVCDWLGKNYHMITLENNIQTIDRNRLYLNKFFRKIVHSNVYCEFLTHSIYHINRLRNTSEYN